MMCKKLRNATRLFGLRSGAGIAQLCPTRGTRTPFNQYLGAGLVFRPFLQWTTLLVILSLLTIYSLYAYYISLYRPMNLTPKEEGYSFGDFVAFVYLGHKDSWTSVLYKFPRSFKRATHYLGHVLSKGLVFAGAVSTIMWLLINNTEFYKSIHSAAMIYVILIVGTLMIAYDWNRKLYKQYLLRGTMYDPR
jgi:hypothetical protein